MLDAHLQRIEGVNPNLNAVVQLAQDARERARAADRQLARGEEPVGVLHGVPFTAKDNIETAGIVTAAGARERRDVIPALDGTVVSRMRAAGAILLGKTNCPEWGSGLETENDLYGRTNNPHDLARTPGGSSGGEAAIVAAGGSPCGLGSDSGGSARIPAHFCGVCALKPTSGLVPVSGVIDHEGPIGSISDPRTQIGAFARSVEDLVAMLDVLAGPDGRDGGVAPVSLRDPRLTEIGGLRIAVFTDGGIASPTSATVAAVGNAAAALGGEGATVDQALLPGDGHAITLEIWASYQGRTSSVDLYQLLRRWDAYRAEMLAFMARYDAILCPVYPTPAPLHGQTAGAGMSNPDRFGAISYTTPFSLVGAPCVVLPWSASPEGLPIGIQLVARPWRDDVALALAGALEARREPGSVPSVTSA